MPMLLYGMQWSDNLYINYLNLYNNFNIFDLHLIVKFDYKRDFSSNFFLIETISYFDLS